MRKDIKKIGRDEDSRPTIEIIKNQTIKLTKLSVFYFENLT